MTARAVRWPAAAGVVALLLCLPAPTLAQSTHTVGAATYVAPEGWDEAGSSDARHVYARIRGNALCMILVYADDPSSPDLDAAFTRAWNTTFGQGFRSATRPPMRMQTSASGYRYGSGEGEIVDTSGNRFVARGHVFAAGRGTQAIIWIGNGTAALDECRPEWDALFSSLRFSGAARADASGAQPAPPPAVAPSPPPAMPTSSSPNRFDNVIFTPPPGWTIRQFDDGVELRPTNTVGQEMLAMWILKGRVSQASLEREFASSWSELVSLLQANTMRTVNGTAYDLKPAGRSPRGWDFLHGTGGVRRPDGTYDLQLYVIRAGDRIERVAVLAREIRETLSVTNASLSPRYIGLLETLVFTLRFANLPDPALPAVSLSGGGITGVWAGLGMSAGRIKPEFAIFFTGGIVYFAPQFPMQGLLGIDPSVEQPARPRNWGTYTMTGATGSMTMLYGNVPLRMAGTALELTTNQTPHRYVRLSMPASGRLNGTWCTDASACLRLTSAGRFQDTGAIRTVEHVTYAYPVSPARGDGQYELRDHTLVLRYDNGPDLRVAFPGLTEDPRTESPQSLMLGFSFDMLTRRD